MTKSNCLDQIKVKAKRTSNIFSNSTNKLLMKAAARNVIVRTERKNLCFAV